MFGVAVGYRFAADGIPEKHAGFGALPGVVHYLAPQLHGVYLLAVERFVGVDGVFLEVFLLFDGCLHECVVDAHRDVGAGHLAFGHLGVYEGFGVGVRDAYGEHQGAASAVLRHLAG